MLLYSTCVCYCVNCCTCVLQKCLADGAKLCFLLPLHGVVKAPRMVLFMSFLFLCPRPQKHVRQTKNYVCRMESFHIESTSFPALYCRANLMLCGLLRRSSNWMALWRATPTDTARSSWWPRAMVVWKATK